MRNLLIALFLSPLAGQRTWVVDAAGGIGVHFLDIPPAVAAATDGDTIVVRAASGSYQLGELTKCLRIVGQGGPRLAFATTVGIRNIGPGKTLVFAGFHLEEPTILVRDCAGAVVLRRLTSATPARNGHFGVLISRSDAVLFSEVTVVHGALVTWWQPATVTVQDSAVHFADCEFLAPDLFLPWEEPAIGLAALRSRVVLTGCTVAGGRLFAGWIALAPAIRATEGVTVLTGRSTVVGAGALAIEGSTTLVHDGHSAIHGAIGAGIRVISAQVPVSWATHRHTAGIDYLDLRCEGQPGDLVVHAIGLLRAPVLDPFGEAWIETASLVVMDVGVVGASGTRPAPPIPLPLRGSLPGLTLASQALVLRGGAVSWSMPATFVLD